MRYSVVVLLCAFGIAGRPVFGNDNMLVNPDFDSTVGGWTPHTDVSVYWNSLDGGGNPGSGSAEVVNASPDPSMGRGMQQCVPGAVVGGGSYDFRGRIFIPSGQTRTGNAQIGLRWYRGPGCTGGFVGNQPRRSTWSQGQWVQLSAEDQVAPDEAVSVLFVAFPSKVEAGGTLEARFDSLYFAGEPIFGDGFETGDTLVWSATNPPFVTTTPYFDSNGIELVGRVFCVTGDCPWGSGYHDGLDFVTASNLVPFRAACDGEVTAVESFITGAGNRQVNVIVELSNQPSFGLVYAFEPMTPDAGNQQDANIFVQVGTQLSAGDLIGNLVMAPAVGSHVHWGVLTNYQQVCPKHYLTSSTYNSLMDLIQRDTPGGEMCY